MITLVTFKILIFSISAKALILIQFEVVKKNIEYKSGKPPNKTNLIEL